MRALVILMIVLMAGMAEAQTVYKTVDEEGNVTYTDQPPNETAEPMELKPLMVVPAREIKPRTTAAGDADKAQASARPYADLTMVEPAAEQNYWGTGGTLSVTLQSSQALDASHSVDYFVDGVKVGTSKSMVTMLTEVFRGEHTISANIVDGRGRTLASAGPVTIHMKQQSAMNPNNPANRPRPSPRRGS